MCAVQWNCGWSVRAATKHAAPAGSSTPGHQPAWSMEHASTRMRTRAGMHATRTQPSVSPAAALTRIQHFRVSRPGAPLRLRPHAPESGGGARRPLSLERSHLRSHSAQSVHRGHNATTVDTYTILAEWHSEPDLRLENLVSFRGGATRFLVRLVLSVLHTMMGMDVAEAEAVERVKVGAWRAVLGPKSFSQHAGMEAGRERGIRGKGGEGCASVG